MVVNQVIITTVGYIEHHILMMMMKKLLLVMLMLMLLMMMMMMMLMMMMMGPHHLFLAPQLEDLTVRIRMLSQHKRWARSGSVFGYEPTRLVPHSASVTQRFWAHGPGPPLRRLVRRAMQALPPVSAAIDSVFLLRIRRHLHRFLRYGEVSVEVRVRRSE